MASVWVVDCALAPIGLFVAFEEVRHRYVFLAGIPLILLIGLFGRERRIRVDKALELGHAYRGTALLLGDVIEADDKGTGTHSREVVALVVAVASRMGLDARARRNAELVALLHDVGKIRVPKEIINKPGSLDEEEWAVIKLHTIWGEEMLRAVGGILADVGSIVRSCHERWDGTGYPDGLRGDRIPEIARIVFACDAYSAMTSDRPYCSARTRAEAIEELSAKAGTQFDPRVVDALVAIVVSLGEAAAARGGPVPARLAIAG
jgi:HD-GYP domain-containing protein (c-di-GMP phosphodiesterase class II)